MQYRSFLNIYLVYTWYVLTLYPFIGRGFYKSIFCQVSGKHIRDLCAWKLGNARWWSRTGSSTYHVYTAYRSSMYCVYTAYTNIYILSIYCSNIQSTSPGHGSRNICVLWAMQFKTSSPGGSVPEKSVDVWTKSLEMFHLALSKSRWDGSCVLIYIYKLVPLGGQLLWRDLRVVNPLPPQIFPTKTRTFPVQTKQGPFPLNHDGRKGRPAVANELSLP